MVISAGPLTRVFTGVASRLGVHAVYLDTQKNLSVFAPRLPWFCGIAHTAITHPWLLGYVSEKFILLFSLSLFPSVCVFAKKGGKKKGERKKKVSRKGNLFTYHLGKKRKRKKAR